MARGKQKHGKKSSQVSASRKEHPPRDPETSGSKIFLKRGFYHIDLRWRNGGRPVLRNPDAPGWPEGGERTQDEATAKAWASVYDSRWKKKQEEEQQRSTGTYHNLRLAVSDFLDGRTGMAPSTQMGDRTALTHLMEAVGENCHPAEITEWDLKRMFNGFLKLEYKAGSLRSIRTHLNVFFDEIGVVPNPSRAVKLPKRLESQVQPWKDEKMQRIRSAADVLDQDPEREGPSRRQMVEFLFGTGVRCQELAAARWEDLDPHLRIVRVAEQMDRQTNKARNTKGKKPRLATVLPNWWEFHDTNATGRIFTADDGRPLRARKIYDYVCEILVEAGVKEVGEAVHHFRHTYARCFLESGGTLDELSICLGHDNIRTTQESYKHLTPEHAARTAALRIYTDSGSIRRGPRLE